MNAAIKTCQQPRWWGNLTWHFSNPVHCGLPLQPPCTLTEHHIINLKMHRALCVYVCFLHWMSYKLNSWANLKLKGIFPYGKRYLLYHHHLLVLLIMMLIIFQIKIIQFETLVWEAGLLELYKTLPIIITLVLIPLAGLQPVVYEFIMDHGFLLVSGHLSRI